MTTASCLAAAYATTIDSSRSISAVELAFGKALETERASKHALRVAH